MDIIGGKKTQAALKIIRDYCLNHQLKISVAESVTAGMLQLMLSTCENAGQFYCGGVTVYSCSQKSKQLQVPDESCLLCEGVSMEIAENMALQVAKNFSSDLSLSLTGFATPIPEKGITELFAFGSFCFNGKIVFTEKHITKKSNQLHVQKYYATRLLHHCADRILVWESNILSKV